MATSLRPCHGSHACWEISRKSERSAAKCMVLLRTYLLNKLGAVADSDKFPMQATKIETRKSNQTLAGHGALRMAMCSHCPASAFSIDHARVVHGGRSQQLICLTAVAKSSGALGELGSGPGKRSRRLGSLFETPLSCSKVAPDNATENLIARETHGNEGTQRPAFARVAAI
ncbi:hypothetical protein L209DRAFT_393344 [Thermothelomyces heterothallicus CBS 203.75]